MPLGDVLHRRLQKTEVLLDLVGDLAAREGRSPGGRELDAQRHPVHKPTDPLDVWTLLVGEPVSTLDLPRAIDEQKNCRAVASIPIPAPVREPIQVEHPLALHLKALPRGRQQLHVRSLLDDLGEQIPRVEQVLEVVEHEQRCPFAQEVDQLVAGGDRAVRVVDLELQALGDSGREQVRCRDTDERDEVNTVLIAVDPASSCLERQSRLTDTARPDQCQQAAVGLVEHAIDRGKLVGPPHERRARSREVPHPRFERLQRRELGGEPADLELEDALRDTQVLEAVGAEVAHVGVHERPRGLRQEHLPSVTDGRDPGSLVDVEADVPLVGEPGLARVQPHPHPDRAARKRPLRIYGCSDSIRCTAKCDKEGVALCVHLGAVVRGKRPPKQSPMLLERVRVRIPQFVQKLRRPLDIREEEGDDTARKCGRHAAMITGRDPRVYLGREWPTHSTRVLAHVWHTRVGAIL